MSDNHRAPVNSGVRTLPRNKQLLIVAIAACVIILGLGVSRGIGFLINRQATNGPAEQPVPTGSFRPTKSQWANLKVVSISAVTFHGEQITDGNIAANDETTTPIFSPYSGRVIRVIAQLGEIVKKGTPLFAIEATEFVQGQNDVITANAALATAEAQLRVAQTTEHRLIYSKSGCT